MKHIKAGMFLCLLCFGFIGGAAAQTALAENASASASDSLVHVAYGTVSTQDLNGAISVMTPSEYLDKSFSANPFFHASAFVGGDDLWGIGAPLILVDGVPRLSGEILSFEIEQITYLKGANAVVLYGSRAANGVILITTKRGHVGSPKISVRGNAQMNKPISYPDYLGSAEYMTYYNQALRNDGMDLRYSESEIRNYTSGNPYRYPSVDYYSSDYLRKMSNYYSALADFSSGSDRAQFYVATGMEHQNTLLNFGEGKNSDITRLNIRGNVDMKLNSFIKAYTNVSAVFYDARMPRGGDYWAQASTIQPHRFLPLVPIELIDPTNEELMLTVGNSRHIIDGKYLLGGSQEYLTNPFADSYAAGSSKYTSRQFQFSTGLDFDLSSLLEGLSLHGQFSIDYSNNYIQSIAKTYAVYVPTWSDDDRIIGLSRQNQDANDGRQQVEATWNDQLIDFNIHMDYARTFRNKHNVSAMLLAAAVRDRQTGDYQNRANMNLGLQLSYNFDHRYYVDLSGAAVHSTLLEKTAFSPTASLGWVLSEEDFLKGSENIDRLKLTASAGIVNTDLDLAYANGSFRNEYFLYDEVYAPSATFEWRDGQYGRQGTSIRRSANPNLGFAKRKELNFGLEASLFDRMLDVRATAFFIKKDGIPLQARSLYPSFFYASWPFSDTAFSPYVNFDENSYTGFDFQVDFRKQIGQFDLELGVAGTYLKSKVLKRDELYADSYQNRAGNPTDAIYGLQSEGFFMSQAEIDDPNQPIQKFGTVRPGDIRYKDVNNDGLVDERDEVMIGRFGAPFSFGVHFTAQWRNLSLFVLANGQFGGTGVKNNSYHWIYGDRKYSDVVRGSWTEQNKATATYPRLTTLSGDNNFRYSDFWTYSTDQVNLSNVQLTYNLPDKLFTGSVLKGVSVYVAGYNLLKIAANRDIMELNVGMSPQMRAYNIGIKALF